MAASSVASRSASSRVPLELSTTVHAVFPAGQVARSAAGAGVAPGVEVGVGVPPPSSGAAVPLGAGVAAGAPGVGVCGTAVIFSAGPASSTIARITAISASASSAPTTAIEARQPRGSAIRVPTAAPQSRHHSCSALSWAPQRAQRRSTVAGGVGVSVALTGAALPA